MKEQINPQRRGWGASVQPPEPIPDQGQKQEPPPIEVDENKEERELPLHRGLWDHD